MNNTETQTREYHVAEWEAFYQECVDQGDVDPEEQDTFDLAEVYFADYDEATYDMEDPTRSIHYSAGVYTFQIEL